MAKYEDRQELWNHIDCEGGIADFFIGYTTAKNITVGDEPLPEEIVQAAEDMENAYAVIRGFFDGCDT